MAAILGKTNFFLNTGMATLQRYPVGQKFLRNRSMQHDFRDISIFVFCNFCEKLKNSKWLTFLAGQNFFGKLGWPLCRDTLWVKNFVEIALSNFGVLQFLRKIRKFKMAAILAETKFLLKLGWLFCRNILWVKTFLEIALSSTVFEI